MFRSPVDIPPRAVHVAPRVEWATRSLTMALSTLPTVGEIARRLQVPVHRVEYLIRARGITPCGRAGNARVFSEGVVSRIAAELGLDQKGGSREHPSH
jgi:hypothetical protein